MKTKAYTLEQVKKYRAKYPDRVKDSLEKSRKNNPERNLYNRAKARAKNKGFTFDLAVTDIVIPTLCPLLGIKLDPWGHSDCCPSLDRIDNKLGYTKENIWVISFKANRMKNTATITELKVFAANILDRFTEDVIQYN